MRTLEDLDAVGMSHNTDKASRRRKDGQVVSGHDLLRHYEPILKALATTREQIAVIDLGVGPSPDEFASAKVWRDFFPSGRVVAVDFRQPSVEVPEGVEFARGDVGDVQFLASLLVSVRPDLMVDDASHWWNHQFLSLVYALPLMQPGGIFIWEDMHTSHRQLAATYAKGLTYSPADLLADLVREIVSARVFPKPRLEPFSQSPPGITEALITGLVPLIDSVTVVPEAAIFKRK
jgi:hypothetical protein